MDKIKNEMIRDTTQMNNWEMMLKRPEWDDLDMSRGATVGLLIKEIHW